ncbi:MAG TPA: hypothetical protein VFA04_05605 [Bryobacteraceae bacterium]|nr:hypothetical protein [Bryobacteraceae bacterium]
MSSQHGSGSAAHVSAADVREELGRVLGSQEFRSSHRSQDFLRYVVENTLNGKGDSLKERTIGIDVYGRPPHYDPADDATVRVKAGEVRKRLDRYYASEGRSARLRIELPAGTYVPEFRPFIAPQLGPATTPVVAPRNSRRRSWLFAAIAVLIAAGATLWLLRPRHKDTVVDEFWQPVVQGSTPVLLTAAFVPVYNLDAPNHYVLLNDQFVGGGDLVAASRIMQMLAGMHRSWQMKVGGEATFADLRSAPTVLIGYSYTRWKEISREMRFFIDADRVPRMVTDYGKPTAWALPNLPADRRTDEDYAIISRVFHPETGAMLVELSGITQYGTNSAAELVTSPALLAEALRNAPPAWKQKNLQFVIHVKVIGGTPGKPTVVAWHFW